MKAADVMVTSVICVRFDASVESIAETLLTNRISAVPVLDEHGAMVGIVSEGDLIHRVEADTERHRSWWLELLTSRQILAHEFVKSHGRKATDVMTRSVVSVTAETPLGEIAALLEKHRIKRVPVVNNGNIVGIVSRANLIQALVHRGEEVIPNRPVPDSELRDNVLAQLQSKPWWPNDVNVIVHDGTVELWGIVDTEIEKEAIRIAVEVTPGVRGVANNLGLKNTPTAQ
jgi:CBS domain-containing protein